MAFAPRFFGLSVTARQGEAGEPSTRHHRRGVMHGGSTYHLPSYPQHNVTPSPLHPMQLLKPFDGRRPHPKGHADGAPHRASSQDENNSADRKNLPSFIVSPLLPLPPSLFATRYGDHDNKMCGEGGCCSLLLLRRPRHPALTIIETAPWFPEEKLLPLLKLSTSRDTEKRDQKRLQPRANCSPLSSHAMRVIVTATVVAPSSRARNWKWIVAAHGRTPLISPSFGLALFDEIMQAI